MKLINSNIQILLTSLLGFQQILSFNLESRLPIIRQGPSGSKFGFTVGAYSTSHRKSGSSHRNNHYQSSYIIVGAPQNDYDEDQKPRHEHDNLTKENQATRPGAIYSCNLAEDDCSIVPLTYSNVEVRGGNPEDAIKYFGRPTENIDIMEYNANCTDQWLGAGLATSVNEDGLIIACAPRWKQRKGISGHKNEEEKLGGQCWFLKYDPAANKIVDDSGHYNDKYFRIPVFHQNHNDAKDAVFNTKKYIFKHATFGTGVGLGPNDDSYILGGPGAWSFVGSAVAVDNLKQPSNARSLLRTPVCGRFADSNAYKQEQDRLKAELGNKYQEPDRRICEENKLTLSSYNGFKTKISNNFANYQGENIYVSSAPNADNTGKILFYKYSSDSQGYLYKNGQKANELETLSPIGEISGKDVFEGANKNGVDDNYAIGTSFGYDFILVDVNGDGFDDLVATAPQYYDGLQGGAVITVLSRPGKNLWDEGWKDSMSIIKKGVDSYFWGFDYCRLENFTFVLNQKHNH